MSKTTSPSGGYKVPSTPMCHDCGGISFVEKRCIEYNYHYLLRKVYLSFNIYLCDRCSQERSNRCYECGCTSEQVSLIEINNGYDIWDIYYHICNSCLEWKYLDICCDRCHKFVCAYNHCPKSWVLLNEKRSSCSNCYYYFNDKKFCRECYLTEKENQDQEQDAEADTWAQEHISFDKEVGIRPCKVC